MLKRTFSALAIAAMASVGVAHAQENVTLILKSGERLSAQLIDHGGVGFTVKVNNEERRIPTNDVAVIDFTGRNLTNNDWNKVTGGNHIAVLRSGQTVSGQFYDIGGTVLTSSPWAHSIDNRRMDTSVLPCRPWVSFSRPPSSRMNLARNGSRGAE